MEAIAAVLLPEAHATTRPIVAAVTAVVHRVAHSLQEAVLHVLLPVAAVPVPVAVVVPVVAEDNKYVVQTKTIDI